MRILNIVGRQGTVVCSDTLTNKAITRTCEQGSSIGELKLLKDVLTTLVNDEANKNRDIRIVVSNKLRGLCNSSTVNHWLITKTSKRGVKLTTEYLGLVSDIVALSYELKNIKFVSGTGLYYGELADSHKRTWAFLERICPKNQISNEIEQEIIGG